MIKQRRSQMEILGLSIVIALMIISAVFIVRFSALNKDEQYRGEFISSEISSNMLNTFLKTSARNCFQLTMTELLQDCAQGRNIRCEDGKDSCKYANSTALEIFSETLDKWNMKYEFLAYTDISHPFIRLGSECKGQKKSKQFPIPISSAVMYVKMDICG